MTDQDLTAVCDKIWKVARVRNQIVNAELRLNNQIASLERIATGKLKGTRKVVMTPQDIQKAEYALSESAPILEPAAKAWRKARYQWEKQLVKAAQELPAWEWVKAQRGAGPLGLGLLVAELGNLSNYSGPSKAWKRMGLAVIDGERQRRIAGTTNAKKLEAIKHGFSPRRRALAHVLAESLLKQNKGVYRGLYDSRKAHELAKLPADQKGVKAWAHRRALRYMFRRFLLHLWCVWNGKPLELSENQSPALASREETTASNSQATV